MLGNKQGVAGNSCTTLQLKTLRTCIASTLCTVQLLAEKLAPILPPTSPAVQPLPLGSCLFLFSFHIPDLFSNVLSWVWNHSDEWGAMMRIIVRMQRAGLFLGQHSVRRRRGGSGNLTGLACWQPVFIGSVKNTDETEERQRRQWHSKS